MSISTRTSIAWGPSFAHSEPTDTLVLTGRTYFVDQRLLKEDNTSAPKVVSWAFAGLRASEPVPGKPGFSKCSWTHLVSSVPFAKDENPADEGVMQPHPDFPNDPEVALETGSMLNPDTGVVTEYEEVWRDKEPEAGSGVLFWEYGNDDTGPDNRGFLAVVERYALGVGRVNGAFWTWRAVRSEEEEAGWRVEFEVDGGAGVRMGFKLLGIPSEKAVPEATKVQEEGGGEAIWVCRESWKTSC
ncbi:hypothetical protein H072_4273 [Dactylellina haptotyla CBS 200.50]|uniref:Protein HRI1 n=1 Tax=Dactylellina haptotyla (strain CBS 200.50) TaxID=1284197 RepID=S8AL31_DACHA|nr:hypothetical protein H072_4273 [Dactylellina haptotyla CBS 200.50]